MDAMTEFRSYHGTDTAEAIQFYWPRVLPNEAKAVAAEMQAIDWPAWSGREKGYQQAKWLAKRLGL